MTRIIKPLIVFAILAACAFAQTPVPGVDYPSPIPVPFIGYTTGYSDPPLCVPGRSPLFLNMTTPVLKLCTARNTWTSPSITGAISGTTGTFSAAASALTFNPKTVGSSALGAAATPFFKLYLGTAATNNFVFTPAATAAARAISVPDPGGPATMNFIQPYWGGTTSTYTPAAKPTMIIHSGTVALGSATPSTVTVTGFSPAFTSVSTYTCTASPTGATAAIAAAGVAVTLTSASSVTFTGPNTVTTVINYWCVGY